jgi:PAS domain S-box-containing protein
MALLDTAGRVIAATPGMPTVEGGLREFVTGAERGSPALLDMNAGPDGRPTMAFLTPVFAVHGDGSATSQVGWALGVKAVAGELFPLLRQPGAPWASAEALLVRRDDAAVTYLSPTTGGQHAFTWRLAFDTADLAAAYAIDHPGGFSRRRDYRGANVLVASRAVSNAPWILLYKIDSAEALGPSEARLSALLVNIALAVAIVVAAFVAVWRHGASRRASATAARYQSLFRRHEAQSRFLRLISDSQPEPMFILDNAGRYTFANRAAAERAGIPAEDMLAKTVESVLGPAAARRIHSQADTAKRQGCVIEEFRELNADGSLRVAQCEHVPVPETPESEPGILVVERDITDAVAERERRMRLQDRLIKTLLMIVDRRDSYAANHSAQVAAVARGIASEMGLDATSIEVAATAGSLMNLGKILIPPELLSSSDNLESFELRLIRESIQTTADLLDDVEFDGPVAQVLRQIQERSDGTGGPCGLKGDDILLPARVVAVANAYVAMISPRAWRPAMTVDEAIERLMAEIGGSFDRRVVAALVNRLDNRVGPDVWPVERASVA